MGNEENLPGELNKTLEQGEAKQRIVLLEQRIGELNEKLIEQDHRFWHSLIVLVKKLYSKDKSHLGAAAKAVVQNLIPGGRTIVLISGGSLIGVLTLYLMFLNNQLVAKQNYHLQQQNYLNTKANIEQQLIESKRILYEEKEIINEDGKKQIISAHRPETRKEAFNFYLEARKTQETLSVPRPPEEYSFYETLLQVFDVEGENQAELTPEDDTRSETSSHSEKIEELFLNTARQIISEDKEIIIDEEDRNQTVSAQSPDTGKEEFALPFYLKELLDTLNILEPSSRSDVFFNTLLPRYAKYSQMNNKRIITIDLSGAYLNHINFQTNDFHLYNFILNEANLEGTNLENANLERSDLSKANLKRTNLKNANLQRSNLSKANLKNANLQNADLQGSVLLNAYLNNSNLIKTDLTYSTFSYADLSGADLSGADLTHSHFHKSILKKAKLRGSILKYADLSKADLAGALSFSCNQLSWAEYIHEIKNIPEICQEEIKISEQRGGDSGQKTREIFPDDDSDSPEEPVTRVEFFYKTEFLPRSYPE